MQRKLSIMKTSRLTIIALLAGGLTAVTWAQNIEVLPLDQGVAQAAPAAAEEEQLAPPTVDYPEPVTGKQQEAAAKHSQGSQKLAIEQDELSADVQDLIEEQTNEKVILLLEQVEEIMGEVVDSLDETETGGQTIAAETEIIEKIFEAAQQRAQQNGGT